LAKIKVIVESIDLVHFALRSTRRCMLREKSSDINLHTGFTMGWRYC